jgi:DNA-binding transcriptional LysR family regulator
METKLLQEFLVLSKELNFSRAAERLNMTQPVLSRHIKYLEEYFSSQIFRRNS